MSGAEHKRVETFGNLANGLRQASGWYTWGPYLSERQWGTVREDYSDDGEAWSYFPHDHARSRAYRWGEDGMAGFADIEQRLCLALALWNGRDPILKERMFGLTGAQGNHGEDVKEYWWYLDAVPSHAWNRWRYHYPQGAVPVRRPDRRERSAWQVRPRVRAARHRRLRRRPLLDRRGRVRQGRRRRPDHGRAGDQRRARGRHAARAPDGVVPQHLVVGRGRRPSPGSSSARRAPSPSPTRSSATSSCSPARHPTARHRRGCSATTRPTTPACTAPPARAVPEGRHQRPRAPRRADGQPGRVRHEDRGLVPAADRRRRDRRDPPPPAPGRRQGQGIGGPRPRRRPRRVQAPCRGRRVLRRADTEGQHRRRGDDDAPGVLRDAVEQAAVRLRRGPLAGR